MSQIEILLPHGETEGEPSRLAPRADTLRGKRVGFIDNELWRSMHILVDEMSKLLEREHGVVGVEVLRSGPGHGSDPSKYRGQLEALSHRVDAVVSGLGN